VVFTLISLCLLPIFSDSDALGLLSFRFPPSSKSAVTVLVPYFGVPMLLCRVETEMFVLYIFAEIFLKLIFSFSRKLFAKYSKNGKKSIKLSYLFQPWSAILFRCDLMFDVPANLVIISWLPAPGLSFRWRPRKFIWPHFKLEDKIVYEQDWSKVISYDPLIFLKVHKIENFFDSNFGI
jgi:hypothetical protein